MSEIEHGTYAGYQRCRHAPDGPCDPCRDAGNAYMKQYRTDHPEEYARDLRRNALLSRAKTILAQRHRGEMREIIRMLDDEANDRVKTRRTR